MTHHSSLRQHFDSPFNISHSVSVGYVMYDYHFHDVFEIYYALSESDQVQYFVENKIFSVQKGDIFVFNHMDIHKTSVSSDCRYERYVITFAPEYVQGLSTQLTDLLDCFMNRGVHFTYRIGFEQHRSHNLLSLFQKTESYFKNTGYGHDVYLKIILSEILLIINGIYKQEQTAYLPLSTHNENQDRLKNILDYIHQNLEKDLSLDQLAHTFYLSKYHLGHVFKKATGFTVMEYIIHRRIIKSRELLKRNLPVYQVAEQVGFNNYAHFIRTFKKLVGVSPKQYAK